MSIGAFERVRRDSSPAMSGAGTISVYWPKNSPWDGALSSTTDVRLSATNSKWMLDALHSRTVGRTPLEILVKGIDYGGPMASSHYHWTEIGRQVNIDVPEQGLNGRRVYRGSWWPVQPWNVVPLVAPSSSYMTAMGTKGIAQSAPTRPQAGLTQFVAELKDIPKAPILGLYRAIARGGRKKDLIRRASKGIGHEYLNIEFGWRPLQQDMKDFHKSVKNASKTIDQLLRDSGRTVRRKRTLRDETITSAPSQSPFATIGAGPTSSHLTAVQGIITEKSDTIRVWFAGAFTYYISAGPSYISRAKKNEQIISKLFGTRFGIDTLWELSPWSWALDWVGNIGDVARNLAAFSNDGLVLRYGYVMYHQTTTETRSLVARFKSDNSLQSTTSTLVREQKLRQGATPFGFGLTWSGFNNRQLAIAAAIGLTRR